ncbi:MAG: hypothetical protein HYX78_06170 [Armatimonadetes bacterium]|nr:hypothetical protein [Armatimonadota bacterium]
MRYIGLILVLLWAAVPASSQDAISLVQKLKEGTISRYNVKVQVAGTTKLPDEKLSMPVDAVLDLWVSHTVGQASKDGSLQVTIAAERASAVISGQKVELAKDLFPPITALVDKNGEITRLFAADPLGMSLPGINYKNMILLFNPYAPSDELKPGAAWSKTLSIPPEAEKYDLNCALEAVEKVEGARTARVKAQVKVIPPEGSSYSATGFAVSNYSLDDVRLIKSHAEMNVKMQSSVPSTPGGKPASDDPGDVEAKVTIDITSAPKLPSGA